MQGVTITSTCHHKRYIFSKFSIILGYLERVITRYLQIYIKKMY